MKLIHHVKKHGKTITLHLKKHHKKYIFGILSATLLRKGVSLIATYALVHNLSFSFADIIHEGNNSQQNETVTETIIEPDNKGNSDNELISNNEGALNDELNQDDEWNLNDEGDSNNELNQNDGWNSNDEGDSNNEGNQNNEQDSDEQNSNDEVNSNTNWNSNIEGDSNNEGNQDNEQNSNDEQNPNTEGDPNNEGNSSDEGNPDNGNGVCDTGDIIIINPKEGDIIGKTFDVSREYANNDCINNSYTIRLRNSNEQYLDIFSGNSEITGFSFNSTELISNYFSGHKIAIVSDDAEIIYRKEEGGEFTIDNKAPVLSGINVNFSTNNKKLNIGDTITISFESDEELTSTTVDILGQSALLENKNGNKYTYTMDFSDRNTTGKVVYGIEYSDKLGNTGYYEGYENIELDYSKPIMTDLKFILEGNSKLKITFNTNKKTDVNFIYQLSGTNITKSINNTGANQFSIILENIKKNQKYDYSIEILDEARNAIYIGGIFYISGNEIRFTNKEIKKSDLLTDFGFTKNENNTDIITNKFIACAEDVKTKDLKLSINKYKSTIVRTPQFNDSKISKLTNAFIAVLFDRVENKGLPQYALDEITEDLNNFLIIVKLVKDDNNECKQNMTEYYINRFKKTLIKYGIIE